MHESTRPLLIGTTRDPHIAAIAESLRARGVDSEVVDETNALRPWSSEVAPQLHRRGLIRSLPMMPSGLLPIEQSAWHDFVEGCASDPVVEWLSPLTAIRRADNKLYQLKLAQLSEVLYPKTIVPSTVADIVTELGRRVVLKPLGVGTTDDSDQRRVFYSTLVNTSDLVDAELRRAPVLAQTCITAERHIRLVTVAGQVCGAVMVARDLPLDWREQQPEVKREWVSFSPSRTLACGSLRLASMAGLGFSSQDWVEAEGRYWFLDLNPNGKWLFLPVTVAEQVTSAIAAWLHQTSY